MRKLFVLLLLLAAVGALGALMAVRTEAWPGKTTACEGCHAYPASSIDVSTGGVTSVTVSPGGTFSVTASYTEGANDGTETSQIAWPDGAVDNALFTFSQQYSTPSTSPTGSMTSTITAPAAGSYTIRVYAATGAWDTISKETDYQNIAVTVEGVAPPTCDWPSITINTIGKGQSPINNPKVSQDITGHIVGGAAAYRPTAHRIKICEATDVTVAISDDTSTGVGPVLTPLTGGISCTSGPGATCTVGSLTATEKYKAVSENGKDTDRIMLIPVP